MGACGDITTFVDAPPADAPVIDAADIDAAETDAPDIDAPDIDAPDIDAQDIDATPPVTITLSMAGMGSGTVTSNPAGIACPGACVTTVPSGSTLTLTAAPQGNAVFAGWSGGGCLGTGTCLLANVTADTVVTATFVPTYGVAVTKTGNGSGGVTSNPIGITCGGDCDEAFAAGTMLTLTATPSITSQFNGWSGGGCAGTADCDVTVNGPIAVNADFSLRRYTLTAAVSGLGGGAVTSMPAGVNCPGDCTEMYDHGTSVTLTAAPNGVSLFGGWSGACTGSGSCVVTMDQARNVTATFNQQTSGLNVARAGTGTGTVTSMPVGINCGTDCSETYAVGTTVTLTAAPAVGSTFTSWSNAPGCGTNPMCVITTTAAATTVTANFTLNTYTLMVNRAGTGTGTVAGAGINCGNDCSEVVGHGTMVLLTPTPATGSSFVSWTGGGCTGTGPCTVTVTAATTVTATFNLNQYTLMVTKPGNGFGTVTSGGTPTVIACGNDCSETLNHGQMITLTAAATSTPLSQDSTFTGWSGGGCSGTGTCVVTMTAATTVSANFSLDPNIAFITSTTTPSDINGIAGADAFCQARATAAGLTGTYRAWLSTTAAGPSMRFGSASGWVRRDGRPFALTAADLFAGRQMYPLRRDENNVDVGVTTFWNATTVQGNPNGGTCGDWTLTDGSTVSIGNASGVGTVWVQTSGSSCSTAGRRLSCFGIDRAATIPPIAPVAGRRAFYTAGNWNPSTGLAGADAMCAMEATAAGYTGTFRALLAANGATAASRFTGTTPFVRPDNVVIPAAQMLGGTANWDAALNTRSNGTYAGNNGVFTGAAAPNVAGTLATTCNNWTTNATGNTVTTGRAGESDGTKTFGAVASGSCGSGFGLYCLQQ